MSEYRSLRRGVEYIGKRLGLTTDQVYREIAAGRVPCIKLGAKILSSDFLLDEFIAEKEHEALATWRKAAAVKREREEVMA